MSTSWWCRLQIDLYLFYLKSNFVDKKTICVYFLLKKIQFYSTTDFGKKMVITFDRRCNSVFLFTKKSPFYETKNCIIGNKYYTDSVMLFGFDDEGTTLTRKFHSLLSKFYIISIVLPFSSHGGWNDHQWP